MSDLADFLLARIAEDEQKAQWAAHAWASEFVVEGATDTGNGWVRAHVARWAPLKILAECEAKRRIIDLHSDTRDHGAGGITHTGRCDTCGENIWRDPDDQFPCETLKAVALPYADRPDYREEWRP